MAAPVQPRIDGPVVETDPPSARGPGIPYGRADFRGIRLDGSLYVDKTRFVRQLEEHNYVLFVRPRRFGKTCWLSMLECYYGRHHRDEFQTLFGGTEIGASPTANRSRYVVLRFDFSAIDAPLDALKDRFEECCDIDLRKALEQHNDLFAAHEKQDVLAHSSISTKLRELFAIAGNRRVPVYVLIDEYDNLANAVLARHGEAAYHALTRDAGFSSSSEGAGPSRSPAEGSSSEGAGPSRSPAEGSYRSFFAALKAGTNSGALERLFVAGVSPLAMDDLTSGFNIGRNLSLRPEFNEMLGFTEDEVRALLRDHHAAKALPAPPEHALATMRKWYNGYRFAAKARQEIYNTDLVLYYLAESRGAEGPPEELIDDNVRVDYGKLRHLLTAGGRLNGNFDLLRAALADGRTACRVRRSFPLRELQQRDNFLSLLHYFGLLSIHATAPDKTELVVPNQTARQLLHSFLRDAYRDVGAFAVDWDDLEQLMRRMAQHGEWQPALDFLAEAIRSQTSVRDYLRGEKMVQGFLAAYLGATDHFLFSTEREFGKGFVDFCLEPFIARHPLARHGYLIELKYLKRGDDQAKVEAALADAKSQLQRYLADGNLERQRHDVAYTGLAVVFRGWELARSAALV